MSIILGRNMLFGHLNTQKHMKQHCIRSLLHRGWYHLCKPAILSRVLGRSLLHLLLPALFNDRCQGNPEAPACKA